MGALQYFEGEAERIERLIAESDDDLAEAKLTISNLTTELDRLTGEWLCGFIGVVYMYINCNFRSWFLRDSHMTD